MTRRHVESQLAARENRARTAPHELAPLISFVRRDQLRQALEVGLRGRESLEHEPDPGLAHPEAALGVVVREVGRTVERTLEIGHVVVPQLDGTPAREPVERGHHSGTSEIHSPESRSRIVVLSHVQRVHRPAVVERALGIGDDGGDRRPRPVGAPRLVRERLVRVRREQHWASLRPPEGAQTAEPQRACAR